MTSLLYYNYCIFICLSVWEAVERDDPWTFAIDVLGALLYAVGVVVFSKRENYRAAVSQKDGCSWKTYEGVSCTREKEHQG